MLDPMFHRLAQIGIPPKVSLMELNNVEVGRCEYTADDMVNVATEKILKLSISRAVR